jgi:hypothetical protein
MQRVREHAALFVATAGIAAAEAILVLTLAPRGAAAITPQGEWAMRANSAVLHWMCARLGRDVPETETGLRHAYRQLTLGLAEDFAVLARAPDGQARVSLVSVCFPSGWRPEAIVGLDFLQIHAPVPAFTAVARAASQLNEAMVTKGPYVRFVWTLSPDRELDHHPSRTRRRWAEASDGYLRVERQLTVPFEELRASLFVIRTFCYPFAGLSEEQRRRIALALRASSDEMLAYKGLLDDRELILQRLENE